MKRACATLAAFAVACTSLHAATIDLSTITEDTTLYDGDVVTGTLDKTADWTFYKLTIADDAKVTLRNATVNPVGYGGTDYAWPAIACEGDATIVLQGENTVKGFYDDYPAIHIKSNNLLTIEGDGSLTVKANGTSAAIGSGRGTTCGSIWIKGGTITATGGSEGGAGIGSGYGGTVVGSIIIQGGTVVATGGKKAAGIGTGWNGTCSSSVVVAAGIVSVEATCGSGCTNPIGAGVGGTMTVAASIASSLTQTTNGSTLTITPPIIDLSSLEIDKMITHGYVVTGKLNSNVKVSIDSSATVIFRDVTIEGENSDEYAWAGVTCLGKATIILEGVNKVRGFEDTHPGIFVTNGYELVIWGPGSLEASSNGNAAGIGSGVNYNSLEGVACGAITIKGGTITATGGRYCAGIGSGNGYCGMIAIDGGTVTATGGERAAGIGSGYKGSCNMVMVGDGITLVKATAGYSAEPIGAEPIGAGYNGRCGDVTVEEGFGDETKGTTRTIMAWSAKDVSAITGDVVYGDGSLITGSYTGDDKISIAAGATVTLSDATINTSGSGTYAAINCEGDATIILEGANTVNSCNINYPAIHVPSGSTLTIKGDGSLGSVGGQWAAGIGSGASGSGAYKTCGNIVIDSGTISAVGSLGGAGIGSGSGSCTCGKITINGGTVTATGGGTVYSGGGAGIGAGCGSVCGAIAINGGAVKATGGAKAAGIGGGSSNTYTNSTCSTIRIAKEIARVIATCGDSAENPIGAGVDGECGKITVATALEDETSGDTRTIKSTTIDLAYVEGDYEAKDGDVITSSGDASSTVTIPAGATVTVNGVALTGDSGLSAPEFAAGGDAATTKFVQGTDGKWTLTAFAEMSNDALGTDVADSQIKVYSASTLEGLETASPMTSGVVIEEKKSAVKTTLKVTPPDPSAPAQFFKVKFGE